MKLKNINDVFKRINIYFQKNRVQDYAIGIDLGTTKTALAYRDLTNDSSDCNLLTFSNSIPYIPSVVALERPNFSDSNPNRVDVFVGNFQFNDMPFYRDENDIIERGVFHRSKLSIGKNGFNQEDYPGKLLNIFKDEKPEFIIACILKEVRRVFKEKKGHELFRATITIPASWNPEQRRATVLAAEMAGFDDVRLLEEPVAALFKVLDVNEYKNMKANVLVVDFGGGTCDIALVRVDNNSLKLLGTGANNQLGGELIDEILFDDYLKKYEEFALCNIQVIQQDIELLSIENRTEESNLKLSEIKFYKDSIYNIKNNAIVRASIRKQLQDFKIEINNKIISQPKIIPLKNQILNSSGYDVSDVISREKESVDYGKYYSKKITILGYSSEFDYKLKFDEFESMLKQPNRRLNYSKNEDDEPFSFIQTFEELLKGIVTRYTKKNDSIDCVYLVGGSSHLYFVKQSVIKTLVELQKIEQSMQNDIVKDVAIREYAVVYGATIFEYSRIKKMKLFSSKLFYNIFFCSKNEKIPILEEGHEISPDGYSTKIQKNIRTSETIPPDKPIYIGYQTASNGIGKELILKECQHDSPLENNTPVEIEINITADGIIDFEIKKYLDNKKFNIIEDYPLKEEDGFKDWINTFNWNYS